MNEGERKEERRGRRGRARGECIQRREVRRCGRRKGEELEEGEGHSVEAGEGREGESIKEGMVKGEIESWVWRVCVCVCVHK